MNTKIDTEQIDNIPSTICPFALPEQGVAVLKLMAEIIHLDKYGHLGDPMALVCTGHCY